MLIAGRFVQGLGGAFASSVILAIIVTEFPRRAAPGPGDGRVRVRRGQRRLDRPAGRRLADPDAELALDLLHQHPDRHLHADRRPCADRRERGDRPRRGARRPRIVHGHRLDDARRVRRDQGDERRLGLGGDARLDGRCGRAVRAVPALRGPDLQPDHAAAHPAQPRPDRLERRPRPARDRHVLGLLPRRAVPRQGPGLRRDAHRPRVPAPDAARRRDVARPHRSPDGPVRRDPDDRVRPELASSSH